MLSLPEDWDYTTRGLASICKDGLDSICSALKELESHGYLERSRLRDSKGMLKDVEYLIFEQPQPKPDPPVQDNPDQENPRPENPDLDEPDVGNPCQENPAQLNTKKQNTKKSKTKSRILKLSPQTIELLKQWKEEQERQKENCAELWIEESFVFTTDYGGHMHPDSITAWYNTFSEQRGLPHIHPHAFRHTAATLMLSSGIDITTVAGELGHSKPTTTANVYSHVIDKQRALAAQARGTLLDDMDD